MTIFMALIVILSGSTEALPRFTPGSVRAGNDPAGRPAEGQGDVQCPTATPIAIRAPMAADSDGAPKHTVSDTGTHQSETSLKVGGQSLDANQICFVVLPLKEGWRCFQELKAVRLGARVRITRGSRRIWAIAGDKGPGDPAKFGEGSLNCLRAFGVQTTGNAGISGSEIVYEFFPNDNEPPPASIDQVRSVLGGMDPNCQTAQPARIMDASECSVDPSARPAGGQRQPDRNRPISI